MSRELVEKYIEAKANGDTATMQQIAMQMAESEPAPPDYGAGDIVRAAGQGLTLGFGDEIEAGVRSLFQDEEYAEIRDKIRNEIAQFREDEPWTANTAEIGGGLLTGGVGGGRAAAAMAARKVAPMVRNIAVGAGEGALQGLGTGQGSIGEQAVSTATGAGLGGAVGGTLGKIFSGGEASRQGNVVADLATNRAGFRDADELAQAVAELNQGATKPWATVADINPGLAKVAADARPPNRQQFVDSLETRQATQIPQMEDALQNTLGNRLSRTETRNALAQQRRAQGEQMYDPLKNEVVTPTPAMMAQLDFDDASRDIAKKALNATRRQWNNKNLELDEAVNQFDFWHNFQQLQREAASGATESARALGGPQGRAIGQARQTIMDDLFGQEWGPAYKAATSRYRTNSKIMEALEDSEKFMKLDLDELADVVDELRTPAERTAFATGVVSDLIEKSMRGPDTANLARNLIKSTGMRRRLETVLGSEKAGTLINQMQKLSKMTETLNEVSRGSQTSTRETLRDITAGNQVPMGAIEAAGRFDPIGVGRAMFGRDAASKVMDKGVAEKTLNLAGARTPDEIMRALAELQSSRGMGPAGAIIGGAGTPVGNYLNEM
jgi:hypothetical protein